MGIVTAAYGLAVLAIFLFVRTSPARHAHLAATFLLLAWFIYNVLRQSVYEADLIVALGALDFAGAIFAFALYLSRPAWWKALLGLLFLCQSTAHAVYLSMGGADFGEHSYALVLNLLFIAELATVAAPAVLFHAQRLRRRRLGLTKA